MLVYAALTDPGSREVAVAAEVGTPGEGISVGKKFERDSEGWVLQQPGGVKNTQSVDVLSVDGDYLVPDVHSSTPKMIHQIVMMCLK